MAFVKHWLSDPRNPQILILLTFILVGQIFLHFDLSITHFVGTAAGALITQLAITPKKWPKKWKSALITACSLSLLLRSSFFPLSLAAGSTAILSKRLFTRNGKHIFNPAAFAIGLLLLLPAPAWVSSGQWGSHLLYLIGICTLALIVLIPSRNLFVGLLFLGFYFSILFIRRLYLGDAFSIFIQQISNGAILVFALFMITDPATSPKKWIPRILFCFILALISYICIYHLYSPKLIFFGLLLTLITHLSSFFDFNLSSFRFSSASFLPLS